MACILRRAYVLHVEKVRDHLDLVSCERRGWVRDVNIFVLSDLSLHLSPYHPLLA